MNSIFLNKKLLFYAAFLFLVTAGYTGTLNFNLISCGFATGDNTEFFENLEENCRSIFPFYLYDDNLSFEYDKSSVDIGFFRGINRFSYDRKALLEYLDGISTTGTEEIYIFLVNSEREIAYGGMLDNGKFSVVFITKSFSKEVLAHELMHAAFNLADEYGGSFEIIHPEEASYPNISLNSVKSEWLYVKNITGDEKIAFYEGAAGCDSGVGRGYPDCLMRNLDAKLCPICSFYAIKTMNRISGMDVDFVNAYREYKLVE